MTPTTPAAGVRPHTAPAAGITAARLRAAGYLQLTVARSLSEAAWQQVVRDTALLMGWAAYHTHDSRRSDAGWPDLVLAGHGRALFVELKSQRGRLRAEQLVWLRRLHAAGCEVAIWRPADHGLVLAVLGREQQRLTPPPEVS
jgi:hypothetical protein